MSTFVRLLLVTLCHLITGIPNASALAEDNPSSLLGTPSATNNATISQFKGVIVVRERGAHCDGSDDSNSIRNAASVATAANLALLFPATAGTCVVKRDLFLPRNMLLRIEQGAKLSPSAGVTVTVNGPFEAPRSAIFTGAGSVVFGNDSTSPTVVYPEWWGATPDNATESGPALQAAITA